MNLYLFPFLNHVIRPNQFWILSIFTLRFFYVLTRRIEEYQNLTSKWLFKCFTVVLLFIFYSFSQPIMGKTINICPNCDVKTIKKGISMALAFDTLYIKKGIYKEYNLKIRKPLTIIGENYPVIDGEKKGEIITIYANRVTVDGLFIKNVGNSYTEDYAAIRIVKSKNFTIQNVVLEKLFFGIYLEKSNHGRVYNNKIIGDAKNEYSSGNGIQLWYSKDILIEKNIIQHVRDGIYLEFSDSIIIRENSSSNNLRYGLHFMFSNHDSYINNVFENNGAGVAVMFSKNIKMEGNFFIKNWSSAAFGILLKEINDAEIIDNTFIENTTGINIEGSNRINYSNNNFINNGWAIKVRGACYSNIFSKNNFLNNSFDVSYSTSLNDNIFDRNYWSVYTGYDLDQNGIGDVPYRPVKLFSYIVNQYPEAILLLRSLFVYIVDFSEKVSPVFTPDKLVDANPLMNKVE